MLTHEIQEVVDELIKRSPSAIATALVFTMAEVINNNKEVTTLDEINELLAVAGVESLMLVDGVCLWHQAILIRRYYTNVRRSKKYG